MQADTSGAARRIGRRELGQHRADVWVAIRGRVYALAGFGSHPGGVEVLRHEAVRPRRPAQPPAPPISLIDRHQQGRDATRLFDEIGHSRAAQRQMSQFEIGVFVDDGDGGHPDRSAASLPAAGFATPDDPVAAAARNAPPAPASAAQSSGVLRGEIHRRPKQPLAPGHSAMDWLRRHQAMPSRPPRRWSLAEVGRHTGPGDLWLVLHGLVYDVTAYLPYHPGGVEELLRGAGRDASALFESVHPWVNVNALLMRCCIGAVDTDS